jgi:lipopolysaccharide export system permease protein
MWVSSFILLIVGGFITYKATTDSAILNIDTYLNIFRRSIGLDKIKMLDLKSHLTGKFDFTIVKKKDLKNSLLSLKDNANIYVENIDNNKRISRIVISFVSSSISIRIAEFHKLYNEVIDTIISSNWFKVTYIQSKVNVFPVISFNRPKSAISIIYRTMAIVLIPVGLFMLIKYYLSLKRLKKDLITISKVAQSIIDIMDSPSLLKEFEIEK